jgi:hypothetical protein
MTKLGRILHRGVGLALLTLVTCLSLDLAAFAQTHIPGPRGMTGPAGAAGPVGPIGADGKTWYSGIGVPSSVLGVNGDFYLRTDVYQFYSKASGAWSLIGGSLLPETGDGASLTGIGPTNVKNRAYGALCDGVANDRAGFVLADTASPAAILVPSGVCVIGSNLTITHQLVMAPGAKIAPATGVVVTLAKAPIASPQQQIFTGAGTISITAAGPTVYGEWWGAVADNSTPSAAAFQAAANALVNGGTIQALPGNYQLACASADAVTITTNVVNLYGAGDQATFFRPTTNCAHTLFVIRPAGQSGNLRDFAILGDQLGVAVTAYNYTGIYCKQCGVSDITHLQFYGVKTALNLPYFTEVKARNIKIQQCAAACAIVGGGTENASGAQVASISTLTDWSIFPGNAVSQLVIDSGANEMKIDHLVAAGGNQGVVIQNTSSGGHRPEHIVFGDSRTNVDANALCNFCVYAVADLKLHGVESAATTSGPSILVNATGERSNVDGVDIVGITARGAFTDDIYVQAGCNIHVTGSLVYGASSASGSTINTGAAVHLGAAACGVVNITGNMMKGNETYANFTNTQGRSLLFDSGSLATFINLAGRTFTGQLLVSGNVMGGNAIADITDNGTSAAINQIANGPTSVAGRTGVDCTGATESTSGLQKLLNANASILVPHACTLLVDSLALPAVIDWSGAGPTSVVKHKNSATGHMITQSNAGAYTKIHDLTLDGNYLNNGGDASQSFQTIRIYAGGASVTAPAIVTLYNVKFINGGYADVGTLYAPPSGPLYWFEHDTQHLGGADGYSAGQFAGAVNAVLTNIVIDPQRRPTTLTTVGRAGYIFTLNGASDTKYNSVSATNFQCFNTGISAFATLGCLDSYTGGDHFLIANSFSKDAIGRGFTWKTDSRRVSVTNSVVSNLAGNPTNPSGNVINAAFAMNSGVITAVGADMIMNGLQCYNSAGSCFVFTFPNVLGAPTGQSNRAILSNFIVDGCGASGTSYGIFSNDAVNLKISNGVINGCALPIVSGSDGVMAVGPVTITDVAMDSAGKPSFDTTVKASSLWYARNRQASAFSSSDLLRTVASNAVTAWTPTVVIDTSGGAQTLNTINNVPDGEEIIVQASSASNALTIAPGGNIGVGSSVVLKDTTSRMVLRSFSGTLYPIGGFFSSAPRILGSSATASPVTGTTTETQLASITIPANAMGANGCIRVTTTWSYPNSANSKTFRIRFGGSGGPAFLGNVVTTTQSSHQMTDICNNNATNVQKGATQTNSFGASGSTLGAGSVDTTAATTLYISGQLANSTETLTLERYLVELIPGS